VGPNKTAKEAAKEMAWLAKDLQYKPDKMVKAFEVIINECISKALEDERERQDEIISGALDEEV
jgi:hypothetical protein